MAYDANSTPAPAAPLYIVADPIPHPALARARLHQRMSALIDYLITILDDLDADPDLEPSLSAGVPTPWTRQTDWADGTGDDREEQSEDEGAITGDDEPEVHD